MRISDWSSDVCSSDLIGADRLDREVDERGVELRDENAQAHGDQNAAASGAILRDCNVRKQLRHLFPRTGGVMTATAPGRATRGLRCPAVEGRRRAGLPQSGYASLDRKSTRLNSGH